MCTRKIIEINLLPFHGIAEENKSLLGFGCLVYRCLQRIFTDFAVPIRSLPVAWMFPYVVANYKFCLTANSSGKPSGNPAASRIMNAAIHGA